MLYLLRFSFSAARATGGGGGSPISRGRTGSAGSAASQDRPGQDRVCRLPYFSYSADLLRASCARFQQRRTLRSLRSVSRHFSRFRLHRKCPTFQWLLMKFNSNSTQDCRHNRQKAKELGGIHWNSRSEARALVAEKETALTTLSADLTSARACAVSAGQVATQGIDIAAAFRRAVPVVGLNPL